MFKTRAYKELLFPKRRALILSVFLNLTFRLLTRRPNRRTNLGQQIGRFKRQRYAERVPSIYLKALLLVI